MPLNAGQQQELRDAVLEFLTLRHPCAFTLEAIIRMVQRRQLVDFDFGTADAASAVSFWKDLGNVADDSDARSDVVPAYRATAAGVAHVQRRRIAQHPEEAEA